MTLENQELLESAGIEVNDAVRRFSGNMVLYEKFLTKFLKDDSFERLKTSLVGNNAEEVFKAAHTLKGVAGNLGMKQLYEKSEEMVVAYRNNHTEKFSELFQSVEKIYQKVCEAIEKVGGV